MNLLTILSCVLLYNVLFCCIHVILTRLLLDICFSELVTVHVRLYWLQQLLAQA